MWPICYFNVDDRCVCVRCPRIPPPPLTILRLEPVDPSFERPCLVPIGLTLVLTGQLTPPRHPAIIFYLRFLWLTLFHKPIWQCLLPEAEGRPRTSGAREHYFKHLLASLKDSL